MLFSSLYKSSMYVGLVVPMPTLPLLFQIPLPGKKELPVTVSAVVLAPPLAVNSPLVIVEEAFERKPCVNDCRALQAFERVVRGMVVDALMR